jgi:hypothetical protein
MDGPEQRRRLASLGRASYISQSGLAAVLNELHANGQLQFSTSRASIKRARDENIRIVTPYGPLVRSMSVQLENPSEMHDITYVHPAAMLAHAASSCDAFGIFLKQTLDRMQSLPTKPLRLVVYSDEKSPGNQLKHDNRRKIQVIYWSIMELGPEWLSSEYAWFTLSAVRSWLVARMDGGMSTLLKLLFSTFFESASDMLTGGFLLNTCNGPSMIFCTLGVMVSDESALTGMGHEGCFRHDVVRVLPQRSCPHITAT